MKSKLLIAISLVLLSNQARAIGPEFGAKVGLPFSGGAQSSNGTDISDGYKLGYLVGPSLNIGLGPASIMIDALYVKRTFAQTGNSSLALGRLEFPVVGNFSLGMFGIQGGLYYTMGLGSINYNDGTATTSQSYETLGVSKSDMGAIVGLSVSPPIPGITLIAELRYNFGFKEMATVSTASFKNRSFDLLVGVYF